MSTGNELDINTLSWVKSEIDETLDQARSSLETYVEDQADESRLQFCLNYICSVENTGNVMPFIVTQISDSNFVPSVYLNP